MTRARFAPWAVVASALSVATFVSTPARAWQIQDPIHKSCHERISHAALRAVGYASPPPPLTGDDARLPEALEIPTEAYDPNIYALSLVLGVRYPDTHGVPDFSFHRLAAGANEPSDQSAHCLRRAEDDGPEGDVRAIAACRATIESLYWRAVASLGDDGRVSPAVRTSGRFNTAFQGPVDYPVSEVYWFAGQAMHALEDSFTHTFRVADHTRVVHVMNWVDQVRCSIDEPRDGHGHEKVMDDCEDGDPSMNARFTAATTAATELLAAITTPGTRTERSVRLGAVLDRWLTLQPGCVYENGYCNHPEFEWLATSSRSDSHMCDGLFGCDAAPRVAPPIAPVAARISLREGLAMSIVLVALALVRRRLRRVVASGAALAFVALSDPPVARADEPAPPLTPDALHASAPPLVSPAASGRGFHAEGRASLSVDNPAYALGLAGLYGFSRADVGAFIELNPWYSVERGRMSMGATNLGALAHYIHPLRPDLRLRFGAGLGFSVLNADMLGADGGKVGVYANVRLLGLVWQIADRAALTVDPFDLALPAPALTGWPVLYTQHRVSVGLQVWL